MPVMLPGARCWMKRAFRGTRIARFSSFTHSACPKASNCSAIRCRGAMAIRAPSRRRYNIVWYRPADSLALNRMCTDASGQLHVGGIAASLIRSEVIAAIKADAEALLAPQLAEIFRRSDPFFQPIFDLESPALAFGRVALTGDAAFVVRPHVGAGATKAAIDATILAECLSRAADDVAGALA